MPVNKKLEQAQLKADSENPKLKKSVGNGGRKSEGTRFGTLADWREGAFRIGETVGRYGRSLRDGQ